MKVETCKIEKQKLNRKETLFFEKKTDTIDKTWVWLIGGKTTKDTN